MAYLSVVESLISIEELNVHRLYLRLPVRQCQILVLVVLQRLIVNRVVVLYTNMRLHDLTVTLSCMKLRNDWAS